MNLYRYLLLFGYWQGYLVATLYRQPTIKEIVKKVDETYHPHKDT